MVGELRSAEKINTGVRGKEEEMPVQNGI